ncbi:hypothetical protein JCM10207_004671 [Rhodosporidiobolus poonsookiae]
MFASLFSPPSRRLLHCQRCSTRFKSTASAPSRPADGARDAPRKDPAKERPPRRTRHHELSELGQAAHRLAFRSLPYGAPPSSLFPQTPQHVTHTTPFFTLRCFPSPRAPPSSSRPPRTPSPESRTHIPSPPPTLQAATSPDPARADPFLDPSHPADAALAHSLLARSARQRKPYTLDLTLMVSKKRVHKSAVIRERCKRRVREAVRLVVVRGARAQGEGEEGQRQGGKGGREGLVLRERKDGARAGETGPGRWVLPGFHYVLSLSSLEVYRAPLPELVEQVREALGAVKRKAENATLAHRLSKLDIGPDPPAAAPPPARSADASFSPSTSQHEPTRPARSARRGHDEEEATTLRVEREGTQASWADEEVL